jgi:hypothetical protein
LRSQIKTDLSIEDHTLDSAAGHCFTASACISQLAVVSSRISMSGEASIDRQRVADHEARIGGYRSRRRQTQSHRVVHRSADPAIAGEYPSRERSLTELTLDPPDATSDQAGVPLLDEGQEWKSVYVLNVVDGCMPSDLGAGTSAERKEEPVLAGYR